MFGRDKGPKPGPGGSSWDDTAGLDPELAELMRLEEQERAGLVPSAGPVAPAAPVAPAGAFDDRADRLRRLADLRDRGVLSDFDFDAEKARILAGF